MAKRATYKERDKRVERSKQREGKGLGSGAEFK